LRKNMTPMTIRETKKRIAAEPFTLAKLNMISSQLSERRT
jgi:hypothetical protein